MNNTARFLSIAAVTAFSAFGAHAETYGAQFDIQSTASRAEVRTQAASALHMGNIAAGELSFAAGNTSDVARSSTATKSSTIDRAAVRAQGADALHKGEIPAGEFTVASASRDMSSRSGGVSYSSSLERSAVRAEASVAARAGKIASGEFSAM